jgi:PAS domain S-box-containing protein
MGMPLLRWRTRTRSGAVAVALCATLSAALLRAVIGVVAPGAVPFATFIVAVLVATLLSGYPAGLLSLATGLVISWYFFLPPPFSFELNSVNEVASLLLFAIVAGVIILLAEMLRTGFNRESARERRLARAQEAGAVGDWEWDLAKGQISWSENLYRLMGRSPDTFQPSPENFASFVHPDDIERVSRTWRAAIANGSRFDTEMRGIWPDGTIRHFVSRGDVIKDLSGKVTRIAAVQIDITKRRETEIALAESEQRYRMLFNAMSEAYVVHDIIYDEAGNAIDFLAIEANPAFETHTGMARELVVGHPASEFAPGGDPEWLRFFAEVVRSGEPDRLERYSPRPQRWVDLRAFPLGGPRLGIIFNDVTKRKQAEADREAAEARLAAAMHVAEVGAYDYNPTTGQVMSSGSYNAIYGLTDCRAERPLSDYVARIEARDAPGFEMELQRALRERDAFGLEYRILTEKGTRWVAARGAVIADPKGGVRLVGAIFDITGRKQAELAREAAHERTEILFREMNHRTKNNLTIVASMLHLQSSANKGDADLRRHLDAARERISTIAELHTSLYQGNKLGEIDFADYIKNLCRHIETSLLSANRGVDFVVDADEVWLSADVAVPLGLVVNELATNAVKHAFEDKADGAVIKVSIGRIDGHLVLSVEDNGRGLPENWSSQNNGFGSRLVDAFVRQVDGQINVARLDGTRFEIVVPFQ